MLISHQNVINTWKLHRKKTVSISKEVVKKRRADAASLFALGKPEVLSRKQGISKLVEYILYCNIQFTNTVIPILS